MVVMGSVIVIEPNLDIIYADYVIDVGPGDGDADGIIVTEGILEANSQKVNC